MNTATKITNEMECYFAANPRVSRDKFSKIFGISNAKSRGIIKRLKKEESEGILERASPELVAATGGRSVPIFSLKNIDIRGYFKNIIERQKLSGFTPSNDPEKPIEINVVPGPDGFGRIIFAEGFHLGNFWADYESILAFLDYLVNNKIGFITLGDNEESFIRPIKDNWLPLLNQILTPQEQFNLALAIFQHLMDAGVLKFILRGNHDLRVAQKSGVDIVKALTWKVPIQYNRAMVNVRCGEATYKGVLLHKSDKGGSMYNLNHQAVRELRESYPDADFIVTGHKHIGGNMTIPYCNRKVPLIAVGCWNAEADYALSAYGKNAFIYAPVLLFDSQKRVSHPLISDGFYLDKIITMKIEDIKNV